MNELVDFVNPNELKLIIAGGRDFVDMQLALDSFDKFAQSISIPIAIVSGRARGADQIGEQIASDYGLRVYMFPADWEKYGRKAGPIRNQQMGEFTDQALIFWDGISTGTHNMINVMHKLNKPYTVVRY